MSQRRERNESSSSIGIPLDNSGRSALQPSDPYDAEDTASDQAPPPPKSDAPVTEVVLPEDEQSKAALVPRSAPVVFAAEEEAPPPPPPPPPARPAGRSGPAKSVAGKPPTARSGPAKVPPRKASTSARQPAEPPPPPPPSASGRAGAAKAGASSRRAVAKGASSRQETAAPAAGGGMGKLILRIAIIVVIVGGLIAGGIWYANRGADDRRIGRAALDEAVRQHELVQAAISNRRGTEARKAFTEAMDKLKNTPQLGGAVPVPAEIEPVVRDLALRAADLREKLEKLESNILAVQQENAADVHLLALKERLAKLADPATDLDALERDLHAYIANPVDPAAGPSPVNAATFARLAGDANLRLADIVRERENRKQARTSVPLRQAALEVEGLIQQELFGQALARIDELKKAHPEADVAGLRSQVETSAEQTWRSAKGQVETRLKDWKAPGSTEAHRAESLTAAKNRLNEVIQRFGIDTYVSQARAMLTPLP